MFNQLKAQQNQAATSRIAKLPDKALFTTHAPSKVDQRKASVSFLFESRKWRSKIQ